jgi:hypothetical protein
MQYAVLGNAHKGDLAAAAPRPKFFARNGKRMERPPSRQPHRLHGERTGFLRPLAMRLEEPASSVIIARGFSHGSEEVRRGARARGAFRF